MRRAWLDLALGLLGWVFVVVAIAKDEWTEATFWLLFIVLLTIQEGER